MLTDSIVRYLLADNISLNDYICGKVPSFEDVKRRLLLLLRSEDQNVPDHYYRLNQRYSLKDIDSLISDISAFTHNGFFTCKNAICRISGGI